MGRQPAYLWITRERPFPPNHGGDWIYSSRMIRATAQAGAEVTVVCCATGGEPPAGFMPVGVSWRYAPDGPRQASPLLLGSTLPAIAARHATAGMTAVLDAALKERQWDAAIVDHIGSAWALPALERSGARVVYLSHNHEASVRRAAALNAPGSLLMRAALLLDASKVGPLERRLVRSADLVGVNTEADGDRFAKETAGQRYLVLGPGYDGPTAAPRDLAAIPRAAVIVGSFGWIAKQTNLLTFLAAAEAPFRRAGVDLTVVGAMPEDFRRHLALRHPWAAVTGAVAEIADWLTRARVGIIPEEVGGGFKHKALNYVFGRVPIAALDGSWAGLPLVPGQSIVSVADMGLLAREVVALIDDDRRLEAVQAAALRACQGQFDWRDRGARLVEALEPGGR